MSLTYVGRRYLARGRLREGPTLENAVQRITSTAAARTCAICERTLLLGERALRFAPNGVDFVDVCPLCQDQAVEYGWLKEGSPTTPTVPDARRRRRLTLSSIFEPRRSS